MTWDYIKTKTKIYRGKFVWNGTKGLFIFMEHDSLKITEINDTERGIFFASSPIPDLTLEGYNAKRRQNRRVQIYKPGDKFIPSLILALGEFSKLMASEQPEEPEPEPESYPDDTIEQAQEVIDKQEAEDYMSTSSEFQDTSEEKEWEE